MTSAVTEVRDAVGLEPECFVVSNSLTTHRLRRSNASAVQELGRSTRRLAVQLA